MDNKIDLLDNEYRQQELQMQRAVLIEYAEANPVLTEENRNAFISKTLSDSTFFNEANKAMEAIASILWAGILSEDEDDEDSEQAGFKTEEKRFISQYKALKPEFKAMQTFYLAHWEQSFVQPVMNEDGQVALDEQGNPLYEMGLEQEQYKQCNDRIESIKKQIETLS